MSEIRALQMSALRRAAIAQYCVVKARVVVMPKAAVLDPQGAAVRDAMQHLGMPEVRSVRIGKFMEIELDKDDAAAEDRLHQLCRELLSNPIIEDYRLEIGSGNSQRRTQE